MFKAHRFDGQLMIIKGKRVAINPVYDGHFQPLQRPHGDSRGDSYCLSIQSRAASLAASYALSSSFEGSTKLS